MTFRYAVTSPHRLAAIAAVAGFCRVQAVPQPRPIRTLYLFGAIDPLSPLNGGMVELPWGTTEWRPSVMENALRWATVNGLNTDVATSREDNGVTWTSYRDRDGLVQLDVGIVSDLGHVWPGGKRLLPESLVGPSSDRLHATPCIWQFFQRSAGGFV